MINICTRKIYCIISGQPKMKPGETISILIQIHICVSQLSRQICLPWRKWIFQIWPVPYQPIRVALLLSLLLPEFGSNWRVGGDTWLTVYVWITPTWPTGTTITKSKQASLANLQLFSVLAPQGWDELLANVRAAESFTSFLKRLKTHLCRAHLDSAEGANIAIMRAWNLFY